MIDAASSAGSIAEMPLDEHACPHCNEVFISVMPSVAAEWALSGCSGSRCLARAEKRKQEKAEAGEGEQREQAPLTWLTGAADLRRYNCDRKCGFYGFFEEVAAHEKGCVSKPAKAKAKPAKVKFTGLTQNSQVDPAV